MTNPNELEFRATEATAQPEAHTCCSTERQSTCCDQSEKTTCCGPAATTGGCSCQ